MGSTISSPQSTYTELNPGVHGSKMDETQVTQVSTALDPTSGAPTFTEVVVHRERVVLGLDTGELVGRPDTNGVDLPTNDRVAVALLQSIDQTLKSLLSYMMQKR